MKFGTTKDAISILIYLIKNAALFFLTITFTSVTATSIGEDNFCKIIECGGSWINITPFIMFLAIFPFFLSLTFILTNGRWKYFWATGIFVGIITLFHFYEEPELITFMALPFLIGGILGFLIHKLKMLICRN